MRRSLFFLVVLIASVACSFDFAGADNVHQSTRSNLHGANAARYLEDNKKDLLPNEDEERAAPLNALTRFKGLFRSQPNKAMEAKQFNKQDAIGALGKLKSLVGLRKTPTKLTQTKLKNLETYASKHTVEWDSMLSFMDFTYGLTFAVFVAGGAIYYGWSRGVIAQGV